MKNSFASAEISALTFCGDGKIYFDETKKLKSSSEGEKFIEMKMTDEGESLEMFSLLWIKNVVEAAAGGPVIEIRKMRNGTAVIETASKEQATKLVKLVNIAGIYSVNLSEIFLRMRTKGVIWCPDLRYSQDQEILEALKPSGVTSIYRLKKRQGKNTPSKCPIPRKIAENLIGLSSKQLHLYAPIEDPKDTGIYFLTFDCELPDELLIGFTKVKVKPFVNNPMRCYKCLKFGHTQTRCKSNVEVCCNCGQTRHTDPTKSERCEKSSKCVNCEAEDHTSFSKGCPIYKKEAEIQVLMKKLRCSYTAAKRQWELKVQSTLAEESAEQLEPTSRPERSREVTAMAHKEVTAKAPKSKPFKESVKKLETGKKRKRTDLRGSSSGESSHDDEVQKPTTSTQSSQRDESEESRPGTSVQLTEENDTDDDQEWNLPKWTVVVDSDTVDSEVEMMMEEGASEEAIKRIKELLLTANKKDKKYLKEKLKEAYKLVRQKARNEVPRINGKIV
jgi:hypothetical protein